MNLKKETSIADAERVVAKLDLILQDLEKELVRINSASQKVEAKITKVNSALQDLKIKTSKMNITTQVLNEVTKEPSEDVDGFDFKSTQPLIRTSSKSKKSRKRSSWKRLNDSDGITTDKIKKSSVTKASRMKSAIFGFFFYMVIAILVLSVYFFANSSSGSGAPRNVFGYSTMVVLTGSMQSEIPQGSVIIAKIVDPNTLEIGDDITYLMDANTAVTHRIIGIYEKFANDARGFETQGIMNAEPDKEIVLADNVVGKVVYHSLLLGKVINFIKDYALYIAIFSALLIGFVVAMRAALSKKNDVKKVVEQS